ncbi:MAG: hypothetical protein HY554_05895 [Elusimicrobia bacterium]|nr:hypothetical protein [Elusimicrobiota bacterium]
METKNTTQITLGIIALGALSRLLPHPDNVTPLAAMALLGGASLAPRQALLAPLAALALSDLFLGFHSVIPFVYASFLATAAIGARLREDRAAWRLTGASLASSVLFFIVTNFGTWLVAGLYARDFAGLAACFTAAIPFFRNAVLGDLFFTLTLFSLQRVTARLAQPKAAVA